MMTKDPKVRSTTLDIQVVDVDGQLLRVGIQRGAAMRRHC